MPGMMSASPTAFPISPPSTPRGWFHHELCGSGADALRLHLHLYGKASLPGYCPWPHTKPVLAFESIRDPGNLGTIIRTADWFGIGHIVCTPDSTDLYNPKVVQSTMGAITRVQVHYVDLESWLAGTEMHGRPVYGTFLDGENIYESVLESNPVILFGNESRGLSGNIGKRVTKRLSIPSFSPQGKGSESLNVASSVAVLCSELKRRS